MTADRTPEADQDAADSPTASARTSRDKPLTAFPDESLRPLKSALEEAFGDAGIAKQIVNTQQSALAGAGLASMVAKASGVEELVRRATATQRTLMPKVVVPPAVTTLGTQFSQIAKDQQRLIDSIMPKSVVAGSALSEIAKSQESMIAQAMKPALDARTMWGEQLAAQRRAILSSLAPVLSVTGAVRRILLPPNLRDVEGLDMNAVDDIVLNEGIAMYAIPRSEIVAQLVEAPDVEHRRSIITERRSDVLADCRAAAQQCSSEASEPYVRYLVAAIDAIEDGHDAAGQALVGSLIDAALTGLFEGDDGTRLKPKPDDMKPEAYDDLGLRDLLAFGPIWRTYQHYLASRKDPIPPTFSRHATAHSVSDIQFTDCNSVQGVMVACALLIRIDEVCYELEAQAS